MAIAPRAGRDAADDEIARRLAANPDAGAVRVVASDAALAARRARLGARGRGGRRVPAAARDLMAQLIYSAIASLDGYVADADGRFDWSAPDPEVHAFVNDLERAVGTGAARPPHV